MSKKPHRPDERTQHGDQPEEREPGEALTAEELAGKGGVAVDAKPVTVGRISLGKRCTVCYKDLPVDAAVCLDCTKGVIHGPLGGSNAMPTRTTGVPYVRNDDHLPFVRAK